MKLNRWLLAVTLMAFLRPAHAEPEALKRLYDQAAEMMTRGELKGQDAKRGLQNFKVLLDLLPTECGLQAEKDALMARAPNTCPDVIKYGYQAERDFENALKRDKTAPKVLRDLYKAAQREEMEATYALGMDFLSRGSSLEETRIQFQRLARLAPDFKDVKELLAQPARWVPLGAYQQSLEQAASKLDYYKGAANEMTIHASDILADVLNPIAPILSLPKEQQPEGAAQLREEAKQLLDHVTKGFPRARLLLTVNWRGIPAGTILSIDAGFPVSTTVSDGVVDYPLTFTTEEEVVFAHGQKPQAVSVVLYRKNSDPPKIKLSASSKWEVRDLQWTSRLSLRQKEYAPFQNWNAFGELDREHLAPSRTDGLYNAWEHVTATALPSTPK